MGNPPATGQRVHWPDVPDRVRRAIEDRIGDRVVGAVTQSTGFSPGLAAILETGGGQRVFVKALGPELNPDSPGIHRREAAVVSRLPADVPVPRFLWSLDEGPGGWVALAFEAIDGRVPAIPWRDNELARVCQAINILGERLTPSPVDTGPERMLPAVFARVLLGWGKLAASASPEIDDWSRRNLERLVALEALAPQAVQGTSLVHMDTRADNVLLAGDRVYIVDWPHACVGASWVDFVGFAPSVAMQGGPAPEELLKRFPSAVAAVPDAVTAAVASIAGYFTLSALQRPPPGIPTVRDFQAAQGIAACRWLAARTGWR